MFPAVALLAFAIQATRAQQVGTYTTETHPSLTWSKCTSSGCTSQSGSITLDANWRWLHATNSSTNCYTGNTWNATLCPDDATCAANCALDGANYSGTYGITTSGNSLSLKFITTSGQKNIGSRVYLMANDTTYQTFNMLNQEIAFDVDMSALPCGLNGAVYFSEMAANGGLSSTNTAGAKYGTGYCDSQCPHDIKFIGGAANVEGWVPSPNDTNAGTGRYGACCSEMDLWEANVNAAAYTPHPCNTTGLYRCDSNNGTECGDGDARYEGVCDKDGCDFNSFRQGNKTFLGPGSSYTIDTTQKITVVTQFLTSTNTSSGTLSEIRRIYVQNGKVIANSFSTQPSGYNSITTDYCTAQKTLFGDTDSFSARGGLSKLGGALSRGVVLVLSIWDDHDVSMLWLDSDYPTTANASTPGIARGNCSTTSGAPTDVENNSASTSITVTYSNIKVGDIGSTYSTSSTTTTTSSSSSSGSTTSTSTSSSATQTKYGQCGGTGYTGPTTCASGSTCTYSNPYYSQCL